MLFDYISDAGDGLEGPPAYDVRSVFTTGAMLPFDPAGITRSAISPGTVAALTQPPTAHNAQPIAALADGYDEMGVPGVDLLDAYAQQGQPVQLLAPYVELEGPMDAIKPYMPAGAAIGTGLIFGAIAGAFEGRAGRGAAVGLISGVLTAAAYRLVAGK